jgi:hypothetical protein
VATPTTTADGNGPRQLVGVVHAPDDADMNASHLRDIDNGE